MRQSEKPSAGRERKRSSAAATASASCRMRSLWFSSISIATATSVALRSYTAASTQVASASARIDTQAPFPINSSAMTTCRGSSRVIIRTRTFVSIARIPVSHALPDALLHLVEGAPLRRRLWKYSPVDLFGRKSSRTPDHNLVSPLVPFQNRSRSNAQFPPHVGRDRNLPLSRDLRVCECHILHYVSTVWRAPLPG